MGRIIFHIDVNSAFLSWSAVDKLKQGSELDIRTVPCIIGGDRSSRRGIVLAKSIPAKQYGIQTAEPIADALRKCPHLLIEKSSYGLYLEYSKKMMNYLRTYTPDIEQVSVDECYMDFTGIAHLYESPYHAAQKIKTEIERDMGFTVNVGISSNKLLAKMASDFEKPNKIHTLFPSEIEEKMWGLPVSELYMAGKSSVRDMEKLEIRTIGDLANMEQEIIVMHLKSHGKMLWNFANGIDESEVETEEGVRKGIGHSTTMAEDISDPQEAKRILLQLAENVGKRLRKARLKANMISVEIKYYTFQSVSRQCQLGKATDTGNVIHSTACKLFDELWTGEPIRLLGIRSSKLQDVNEPEQLSLFDFSFSESIQEVGEISETNLEKSKKLDQALDQIRTRFGEGSVNRASLMKKSKDVELE